MNPILATGLIGIGERIVDNLMGFKPSELPAKAFDSLLGGSSAAQPAGELSQFLAANQVSDFKELGMMSEQLQSALVNHPDVSAKLSGLAPGASLSVKITDGNLITLEGPDGTLATLPKDSEAGQIATKLHQVKGMLEEHKQLPGAELSQLVANMERSPLLNASWVLREGLPTV